MTEPQTHGALPCAEQAWWDHSSCGEPCPGLSRHLPSLKPQETTHRQMGTRERRQRWGGACLFSSWAFIVSTFPPGRGHSFMRKHHFSKTNVHLALCPGHDRVHGGHAHQLGSCPHRQSRGRAALGSRPNSGVPQVTLPALPPLHGHSRPGSAQAQGPSRQRQPAVTASLPEERPPPAAALSNTQQQDAVNQCLLTRRPRAPKGHLSDPQAFQGLA